MPDGIPASLGRLTRLLIDGEGDAAVDVLRQENFVLPGVEVTPEQVMNYFGPALEPLSSENYTFSRTWLRRQAARLSDPRREEAQVGRLLNLPPSYLLIHRVTLGSIAILCQLGATAPYRQLAEQWQPGFAD